MSFSHTLTYRSQSGAGNEELAVTKTGSSLIAVTETVANGATDFQINVAIDVSAVKSFWLSSDQNVTFETNSGSSPTNTITLVANVPYVWDTSSYDTFKLTGDVTAVFVTNASGSSATVRIRGVQDATP